MTMKVKGRPDFHARVAAPCGCVNDIGGAIDFCPLHAAAEEMRAQLETLVKVCAHSASGLGNNLHGKRIMAQVAEARALLAKVTA